MCNQCYSHNPCICHFNCTCNGQSITCVAKRLQCSTRVYTWSFNPTHTDSMGLKDTIIMASDLIEIRNNLVQEQKDRSAHWVNQGSTVTEGFDYDVPRQFTTSWDGNAANGEFILASSFIQLKTLCEQLVAKAGGITSITKTAAVGDIIYGTDITMYMKDIDYSHMACICNAKNDCACRNYCACNSHCMNCSCNTGHCSCNGACSCNCGPCSCNGACGCNCGPYYG